MNSQHDDSASDPGIPLMVRSGAMRTVLVRLSRAAALHGGVLLAGEPGTGRRTLAREVHRLSGRAAHPFEQLDCSASSPAQVEHLLFGTPAPIRNGDATQPDLVADESLLTRAQGGTLFLSRIEALPAPTQRRLARVLDEGVIRLAESRRLIALSSRPVASTDSLADMTCQGGIRLDLSARVAATRIDVPPLRRRPEDIPGLVQAFLEAACLRLGVPRTTPDERAMALLQALPWYGNLPELRAAAGHLALTAAGRQARVEDVLEVVRLDGPFTGVPARLTLREATRAFERGIILSSLERHHGCVKTAAGALGIQRPNIYRKLRELGVSPRGTAVR